MVQGERRHDPRQRRPLPRYDPVAGRDRRHGCAVPRVPGARSGGGAVARRAGTADGSKMTPKGLSADVLSLASPRHGHFRLESGHHANLWLDLEGLFVQPALVRPYVTRLARALRPHKIAGVCGPLVGGALLAQLLAAALKVEFFFTERAMPGDGEGLYQAQYRLPRAARGDVLNKRLAIVDDAMSAGSAVRATYAELQGHGAEPVVVGALLVLGSAASPYFAERGVRIEAVARLPFDLWVPAECPLCASGQPLADP